jgi:hypothetical protein
VSARNGCGRDPRVALGFRRVVNYRTISAAEVCKAEQTTSMARLLKLPTERLVQQNLGGPRSGRRVCITRLGYIGLVPPGARLGDEVCLLRGAQVPYVMRKRAGEEGMGPRALVLVGEAHLHGVMDGVFLGRDGFPYSAGNRYVRPRVEVITPGAE